MRNSSYARNLIARVIDNSISDNWEDAVQEWDILDCVEDHSRSESCICGKENLYYLFTIKNRYNGNTLFPIGSSCIEKFGRTDLSEQAGIQEGMFRLYHAIENGTYISLSPDFFSRKILRHLYEVGAFDTNYNHYIVKAKHIIMRHLIATKVKGQQPKNFFWRIFKKMNFMSK